MARRRRPGSTTSVVEGRAEVIIPVSAIENADGVALSFASVRKSFPPMSEYPGEPPPAPRVSLTIDRFVYDLHLGDVAHQSDTHDGDAFLEAARLHGNVAVFVVDEIDPRRSKLDDIIAAARSGNVVGGTVAAFVVDMVDS